MKNKSNEVGNTYGSGSGGYLRSVNLEDADLRDLMDATASLAVLLMVASDLMLFFMFSSLSFSNLSCCSFSFCKISKIFHKLAIAMVFRDTKLVFDHPQKMHPKLHEIQIHGKQWQSRAMEEVRKVIAGATELWYILRGWEDQ